VTAGRILILVALAGLLSGCGGKAASGTNDYRGSIPPPGIHAPDFALRSYRGPIVRMSRLRGKVVLVTFLDSKCKESCPVITAVIAIAMHRLSPQERRQVEAVAITVEPHLDTPASVQRFLAARRAIGFLDFLIGSVRQLRPVWKAYGVLPALDTGSADIHSASVRVFNRDDVWVSNLHTTVDLTPANLLHDVRLALAS